MENNKVLFAANIVAIVLSVIAVALSAFALGRISSYEEAKSICNMMPRMAGRNFQGFDNFNDDGDSKYDWNNFKDAMAKQRGKKISDKTPQVSKSAEDVEKKGPNQD